jgi:hypothetical protein
MANFGNDVRALRRDDGYLHGIHELLDELSQRQW